MVVYHTEGRLTNSDCFVNSYKMVVYHTDRILTSSLYS